MAALNVKGGPRRGSGSGSGRFRCLVVVSHYLQLITPSSPVSFSRSVVVKLKSFILLHSCLIGSPSQQSFLEPLVGFSSSGPYLSLAFITSSSERSKTS